MKFKVNEIKEHFSSKAAEYLIKKYPNGFELIDIINKDTPDYILMEPFLFLYCSEEESNKLYDVLNIMNSNRIVASKEIIDSYNVNNSKFINNCNNIFWSRFCYDSFCVDDSTNITDSQQIFRSNNILRSRCIFSSSNIENSEIITYSYDIKNSFMLNDCKNCEDCILCNGIKNMRYAIFNVEVSKASYNMFKKMLLNFIRDAQFGIINEQNVLKFDYTQKIFRETIDKEFWDWALKLPNYDDLILYRITGNIDLLRK